MSYFIKIRCTIYGKTSYELNTNVNTIIFRRKKSIKKHHSSLWINMEVYLGLYYELTHILGIKLIF